MFNLGYKEIVLNSLASVDVDAADLAIKGYGTFNKVDVAAKGWTYQPATPAVAEVSEYEAIAGSIAVGDAVEVVIKIRSTRQVSDLARDFIQHGKSIVFQSAPVVGTNDVAVANAIIEGWRLFLANNGNLGEVYFDLGAGYSASDFEITVRPGYEHVTIKSVQTKIAQVNKTVEAQFITLLQSVTTVGNEGLGLGKFVEESRRMATPENVMPYAQQHGGNSQGVDVRGIYSAYYFEASEDSTAPGWAPHEYVDHSFVQAEMTSTPRKYVVYILEPTGAATDPLATFFV